MCLNGKIRFKHTLKSCDWSGKQTSWCAAWLNNSWSRKTRENMVQANRNNIYIHWQNPKSKITSKCHTEKVIMLCIWRPWKTGLGNSFKGLTMQMKKKNKKKNQQNKDTKPIRKHDVGKQKSETWGGCWGLSVAAIVYLRQEEKSFDTKPLILQNTEHVQKTPL